MDGKDGDNGVCTSSKRGTYQEAIEYHEKDSKIAKEIGDRAGEGRAYGNLGIVYQLLGNYKKPLSIRKNI